MHDMHCHLNFIDNAEEVAQAARQQGTLLFANTVTPDEWLAARDRFAAYDNVVVGFGLHPWWVAGDSEPTPGFTASSEPAPIPEGATEVASSSAMASVGASLTPVSDRRTTSIPASTTEGDTEAAPATALVSASAREWRGDRRDIRRQADTRESLWNDSGIDLGRLLELLDEHEPRIIGEVGLDFGKRHRTTRDQQAQALRAIAEWAARREGTLLSLHSVHAAADVLDMLEETGALGSCTCVFHWFTGPSDQLKRAVQAGCYFSVGPRMLASGKGREYVKAIPVKRLLLETDDPPERGMPYSFDQLRANLQRAADGISTIKGPEALQELAATSQRLLFPG